MNFFRYVRFKYLNTPHKLSYQHHINHHMEKPTVTSTKKSFDKIQYPGMIKIIRKQGMVGNFPNLMKNIYRMPTTRWITLEPVT